MFYLDTNVIIDAIRGKHPIVKKHFEDYEASQIAIPSVVIAELEFGAQHSGEYELRKKQYQDFISAYQIIPFNQTEAVAYGTIRQQLTADGTLIGSNDMLIAAMAFAHNATVVTHNVDEFSRVRGLTVVDWQE